MQPPSLSSQCGFRTSDRYHLFDNTASDVISLSGNHPSEVLNVDETLGKYLKLSSYLVDPTAAYENKSDWELTVEASERLAIDISKESPVAYTPLKSVVEGLSAVLEYCDVWHVYFFKPPAPLTFETGNDAAP